MLLHHSLNCIKQLGKPVKQFENSILKQSREKWCKTEEVCKRLSLSRRHWPKSFAVRILMK